MRLKENTGATAVEFALILPLLLLLLFGIIEFGFVFFNQAILTNASREGARRAIVFRTDSDGNRIYKGVDVENAVKQYLYSDYPSNANLRLVSFAPDNLTISPNGGDGDVSISSGDYILVEVEYDYDFLIMRPLVSLLEPLTDFPEKLTLVGRTTMRAE